MRPNTETIIMYNQLLDKVQEQLREEFPDIRWIPISYNDLILDDNGMPTKLLLVGSFDKGNNEFESGNERIRIPWKPTPEGNLIEDENYREIISKAGAKLRAKILAMAK